MSRRIVIALRGKKPQKALVYPANEDLCRTLKSAEVYKRIVNFELTLKFGDCCEGLEGAERQRLDVTNMRHNAIIIRL